MPNRIIKDSIWTSDNLNELSVYAERHFYRILLLVDDYGCFLSTPIVVKGICYPLKEDVKSSNIQEWQRELEEKNILVSWSEGGRRYSMFRSFDKHNAKYSVSNDGKPTRHRRKTPEPPDDILCQPLPTLASVEQSVSNPKPKPKPNPKEPLDPVLKEVINLCHEEGFPMVTPMNGERLQELIDNYPIEQVKRAIGIAAANGKRKMAYVAGILRNDSVDGSRKGKDGKQRVQKSARFPEQYRSPDELRQTLQ